MKAVSIIKYSQRIISKEDYKQVKWTQMLTKVDIIHLSVTYLMLQELQMALQGFLYVKT